MTSRIISLLAVAFAVVGLAIASKPPERVQIVRASTISWDDEPVVFMIQVDPRRENTALVLVAVDQDGFSARQSYEQLDGAEAPRTRWIRWAAIPAGSYVVFAAIFEAGDDFVAKDSVRLEVLARR